MRTGKRRGERGREEGAEGQRAEGRGAERAEGRGQRAQGQEGMAQ
jgi:hypothetical protein